MALQTLALKAYNLATGTVIDYSDLVEALSFTTTGPGGYGDLSCKLRVPNGRLLAQRPELALMARVAVMDGPIPAYLGRWSEPAVVLPDNDGDLVELTAQGCGDALKDDSTEASYSAQTALQILIDQLTSTALGRDKTLSGKGNWFDADTSGILPDNPAAVFSEAYNGKSCHDVLNDLLAVLGDYTWAAWGHSGYNLANVNHADALGFPTWQLNAHVRDTSTVAYIAYNVDEISHNIRPSTEDTYNAFTVLYRDSATGLSASVTVTDSRLNVNKSQGTAPFPWRRLRKDHTGLQLTSAEATNIANQLAMDYKNGGAKIEVGVGTMHHPHGAFLPPLRAPPRRHIFLPELAAIAHP